jgi:hypothetical protein
MQLSDPLYNYKVYVKRYMMDNVAHVSSSPIRPIANNGRLK